MGEYRPFCDTPIFTPVSSVLLNSFYPYFPEKVYTWPTAVLVVIDVYTVGITVDGEVVVPGVLTLWVQAEDGGVEEWNIY